MMEDPSVEICVLCCREIQIYAVGLCDHLVCFECSTRMRVLCEQNECPICRGDMTYVLFTHKKQPFSMSNLTLIDKKYMIIFDDEKTKEAFQKLLKHNCKICEESFDTFKKLEIHVRRQHKMQFCDLCVGSLKIFTFERKIYSRADLALHKRQGDSDDTSHRGHPLCKFCQTRFVDHDEQFRHLRREHFFCHFCDADGLYQYYSEYSYLKDHFRIDHFLCEEGECAKEQQFISSVFRNKLDLQAHKALNHSKNKTKAEAKQARTLDLEFSFAPRSMQNGERSPNHSDFRRGRQKGHSNQKLMSSEEINQREQVEDSQESQKHQVRCFNTSAEEFPTLSGESRKENNNSIWLAGAVQHRTLQQKRSEDFPALAPLSSGQNKKISRPNNIPQQPKIQKSPWNDQNRIGKFSQSSSAANTGKSKSSSQWNASKVTKSEEEFPRLETKKVFQNDVPKQESNQKCWPTNLSSQTAEQLGQEIYEKCKSKKKKKNTANNPKINVGFEDKVKPNQPDLTRIYSGISDYNMNGYDENQDPLQAAKAKCLAYERPKKVTDDEDDCPWREKPNFIEDDFPPLEISESTKKGPPGFLAPVISSLPPPGFSTKLKPKQQKQQQSQQHQPTTKSISLKSVAQQLASVDTNDLQSKAIKYSFVDPPCFQERNKLLIDMIYDLLEENNESFDRFRILSGNFRKDKISVQDYHTECISIFGKEKFLNLFTELVCLLPDIGKQQELLTIHNQFLKNESRNRGAVPKGISLSEWPVSMVTSCSTCMQVVKNTDYSEHTQHHNYEV